MKSRLRTRQARRAVLWGIATFAIVQLGLTVALEFWLPQMRDPNYAFKTARLKQRIRAAQVQGIPPRVVVMVGSSRVDDGLRGAVAEGELAGQLGGPVILFNLGIPGEGPLQELLNLERLLAEGIHPDLLLVEVLPSWLSRTPTAALFRNIPAERLGLRDRVLLKRYHFPLSQLSRDSWLCWAVPCYAHRQEMLSLMMPHYLPDSLRQDRACLCDRCGWICGLDRQEDEERRQISQAALGTCGAGLTDFRLGNDFSPLVEKILSRCRQEHIRTALVLMPEGQPFRQLYTADAWMQISTFLDELSTRYQAPIINAREWVADDGFRDYNHLLPRGAIIFTRRLAQQLVPLLSEPSGASPARSLAARGGDDSR